MNNSRYIHTHIKLSLLCIGLLFGFTGNIFADETHIDITVNSGAAISNDFPFSQKTCDGIDAQGITTQLNLSEDPMHIVKAEAQDKKLRVLMSNLYISIANAEQQGLTVAKKDTVGTLDMMIEKRQPDDTLLPIYNLKNITNFYMMRAFKTLAFIMGFTADACQQRSLEGDAFEPCEIDKSEHLGAVACTDPETCELLFTCTVNGKQQPCLPLFNIDLYGVDSCTAPGDVATPPDVTVCEGEGKVCCSLPDVCPDNYARINPNQCDCNLCIPTCGEQGQAVCCKIPEPCPEGAGERICKSECLTKEKCLGGCPDGTLAKCCDLPKLCANGKPTICPTDCSDCNSSECPDPSCMPGFELECRSKCTELMPCAGDKPRMCASNCPECADCPGPCPDGKQKQCQSTCPKVDQTCPAEDVLICKNDCKQPPAVKGIPIHSIRADQSYLMVTPAYIPTNKCVTIMKKPNYTDGTVSFQVKPTQGAIKNLSDEPLTFYGLNTDGTTHTMKSGNSSYTLSCASSGNCGNNTVRCLVDGNFVPCDLVAKVNLFACGPVADCSPCDTSCPATGCKTGDSLICRKNCTVDCNKTAMACPDVCELCPLGSKAICEEECCINAPTRTKELMAQCSVEQPAGYFEFIGAWLKINHYLIPRKKIMVRLKGNAADLKDRDTRIELGMPADDQGNAIRPNPEGFEDFRSYYNPDKQGPIFIQASGGTVRLTDPHLQGKGRKRTRDDHRIPKQVTIQCHDEDGSCVNYFRCWDRTGGRWNRVCCDAIIDRICIGEDEATFMEGYKYLP